MKTCCCFLFSLCLTSVVSADSAPSYTMYGTPGLIDMPSAEMASDGMLAISEGYFEGGLRTTVTSQILPNISASFRYAGHGVNGEEALGHSNWDRSFDVRWQFVKESETMPALAMGLNDFIGTGRYSGEYIVATKNIGPVKITGGLGFGRLATHGAISNPMTSLHDGFRSRADRDIGKGGTTHYAQWFRGDMAPFGGLEWQVTPNLRALAEYSSDDYDLEKSYFDQKTPVNVGLKYQARPDVGFGIYYLHGTTVAVSAHITADPMRPASGSGRELAPLPVRVRGGSSGLIVAQTNYDAMIQALSAEGMVVRGIDVKNDRAVIQLENKRYRSHAQAAGRAVRIASFLLADAVENIVIEFVDKDLVLSSIGYDRSEFERLETQVSAGPDLLRSITFSDAQELGNWQAPEKRFQWGLGPYLEYSLFDPLEPIKGIIGAKLAAQYTLGPGFKIAGEVRKPALSSFKSALRASDSVLPHVRSDAPIYKQQGDPALHSLTLSKLTKLSPTVYARATAGYLEPMFAGVSGEFLWKPSNQNWGLGAELNYVKQRDFDQGFGVGDYAVTTGHVSGYLEMENGLMAQLDVGQYLAGDKGGTLTLAREFGNGWQVGGYFTLTDVSFDDFGEGSFDKGIFIKIPMDWMIGSPSMRTTDINIQAITRDGGAKLYVQDRLYPFVSKAARPAIQREIGRTWK